MNHTNGLKSLSTVGRLVNLFNENDTFFVICLGVGSVVMMSLSFGVMIIGMIWF